MTNPYIEGFLKIEEARKKGSGNIFTEAKRLDPVGKEDGDIDNDGDSDSSDRYLKNRREAIAKAVNEEQLEDILETMSTEELVDIAANIIAESFMINEANPLENLGAAASRSAGSGSIFSRIRDAFRRGAGLDGASQAQRAADELGQPLATGPRQGDAGLPAARDQAARRQAQQVIRDAQAAAARAADELGQPLATGPRQGDAGLPAARRAASPPSIPSADAPKAPTTPEVGAGSGAPRSVPDALPADATPARLPDTPDVDATPSADTTPPTSPSAQAAARAADELGQPLATGPRQGDAGLPAARRAASQAAAARAADELGQPLATGPRQGDAGLPAARRAADELAPETSPRPRARPAAAATAAAAIPLALGDDGSVPAGIVSDDMSFGQAFRAARNAAETAGHRSSGRFTWRGNDYQTNIQGERFVPYSRQTAVGEETITPTERQLIESVLRGKING